MEKLRLAVFISLTSLVTTCQHEQFSEHANTIEGLKLNYTQYLDEMGEEQYFQYYGISPEEHRKRSDTYQESVHRFYNSDKGIIDYLLRFEDSTAFNEWLFLNKSPLSSNIRTSDLVTKSKAALLLIDYYLRRKGKAIKTTSIPHNLTYQQFQVFYEKNKHNSIRKLRRSYRKFIRSIE